MSGRDPFDDFAIPPPAEFFRGTEVVFPDGRTAAFVPLHARLACGRHPDTHGTEGDRCGACGLGENLEDAAEDRREAVREDREMRHHGDDT